MILVLRVDLGPNWEFIQFWTRKFHVEASGPSLITSDGISGFPGFGISARNKKERQNYPAWSRWVQFRNSHFGIQLESPQKHEKNSRTTAYSFIVSRDSIKIPEYQHWNPLQRYIRRSTEFLLLSSKIPVSYWIVRFVTESHPFQSRKIAFRPFQIPFQASRFFGTLLWFHLDTSVGFLLLPTNFEAFLIAFQPPFDCDHWEVWDNCFLS